MIPEIIVIVLLLVVLLLEAVQTYLVYKALPKETKQEITKEVKQAVVGKPETKIYAWKPPIPEEQRTIIKVLKKIFHK
jgi:flagellar biosynthesis protein FlhB